MSTPFNTALISIDNGFIAYWEKGLFVHPSRFIARFKHKPKASAKAFVAFLCEHFTVEEYFGELDAGKAPLEAAKSKGYIQPHIKRWLRKGGYEVSQEGYAKFFKDQADLRRRLELVGAVY